MPFMPLSIVTLGNTGVTLDATTTNPDELYCSLEIQQGFVNK